MVVKGADGRITNDHDLGVMPDGDKQYPVSFDDIDVGSISSVYLVSHGADTLCVDHFSIIYGSNLNLFSWDAILFECFSYTGGISGGCEVVQFWDDDNEVQFTEEPCQIIPPPTPLPTAVTSHPTRNPSIAPSTYSPTFTPTTITVSPSAPLTTMRILSLLPPS